MNEESRGNPNIDPAEEKAAAEANAAEESQQGTADADDGKSAAAAAAESQRDRAYAVSKDSPPEPMAPPPVPAGDARWLGHSSGAGLQAGWAADGDGTGASGDPLPVAELEVDGRWHSDAVPRRVPRRVPLQPLGNPLR